MNHVALGTLIVCPQLLQQEMGWEECGRLLVQDVKGELPTLGKIWADQGYAGQFKQWATQEFDLVFEVVYPWWR